MAEGAGANWQAGRLVGGLEGDLSLTDIKASSLGVPTPFVLPGQISTGSISNSGAFDLLGSGRAGSATRHAERSALRHRRLGWTRFVQNTNIASLTAAVPPPGDSAFRIDLHSNLAGRLGRRRGRRGQIVRQQLVGAA